MSLRAFGLAASVLCLLGRVVASGADATGAKVAAQAATGGTLQLTLYMLLLVGLLAGGIYVMKNGLGFLQPKPKGPRKLEISETRMLGNRQFLIVAEYEQRKMLIGVCPGRIDYLCTLSGTEPEFPKIPVEEEA